MPKNSPASAGGMGSIPGSGRSLGLEDPWVCSIPGEGNGDSLQYSCLGNPMDGRVWWEVHGVAKSQAQLSN